MSLYTACMKGPESNAYHYYVSDRSHLDAKQTLVTLNCAHQL